MYSIRNIINFHLFSILNPSFKDVNLLKTGLNIRSSRSLIRVVISRLTFIYFFTAAFHIYLFLIIYVAVHYVHLVFELIHHTGISLHGLEDDIILVARQLTYLHHKWCSTWFQPKLRIMYQHLRHLNRKPFKFLINYKRHK